MENYSYRTRMTGRSFPNDFEYTSEKDLRLMIGRRDYLKTIAELYLLINRIEGWNPIEENGDLREFHLSTNDDKLTETFEGKQHYVAKAIRNAIEFGLILITNKEYVKEGEDMHPRAYIYNPQLGGLIKRLAKLQSETYILNIGSAKRMTVEALDKFYNKGFKNKSRRT